MSPNLIRAIIAQGVILVTVCTGAWMMLIEPRVQELEALETSIDEAQRNAAKAAPEVVERLVNQRTDLASRIRQIESRNQFAADSSEMYRRLMTLAERSGVVVDRISPGKVKPRSAESESSLQVTNFEVTVEGSFREIADYLHEIDRIDGFIRPVSLTLVPRQSDDALLVEARFTCDAMSFSIPEPLLAAAKESGDDP